MGVAFQPGEGRYKLTLTGPSGAAAGSGADCFGLTSLFANRVNYAGIGT